MITIRAGQTAIQDPNDERVYGLNWDDENLPEGVTLADAGTITITAEGEESPTLEYDQLALMAGSRSARVRLSGGTLGRTYRVAHRIVTSENPDQTKEQSFRVLIQNR